ncbi:hypothetical protein BDV98DRAFT_657789 [Pterulicium gracile]|uniref:Uncharacterized protein n=1 Tax=Pterulicium gracile TaxID=1884261 RepID=A0A5C3QCH9_9AGAR|nr:hypothetical protein BDV98DRAFT_657789 [Pterula gracilis]
MTKLLEFALAVTSLILLRLWVTRTNLDHVPALGRSGMISSYFDLRLLRRDGVKLVARACRDLQVQMFKIPFLAYWAVVVCSPKVIDEIKNGKDDELSFHEVYHGSYRWPPDYPKSREDSV